MQPDADEVRAGVSARAPLGYISSPQQMADAALFLVQTRRRSLPERNSMRTVAVRWATGPDSRSHFGGDSTIIRTLAFGGGLG